MFQPPAAAQGPPEPENALQPVTVQGLAEPEIAPQLVAAQGLAEPEIAPQLVATQGLAEPEIAPNPAAEQILAEPEIAPHPAAAPGLAEPDGVPNPAPPVLIPPAVAPRSPAVARGGNSGATAEPRRSTREGKGVPAMAFDPTPQTRSEQLAVQKAAALAATTQQPPEQVEPACYAEAISCAACDQWRQAMDTEMSKHHERGTYVLCEKPRDRTIVGCKWVYKLKRDNKGNITSYKARLVATGFSQKPGINYCCSG
jgi:hypothetical protein